MNKAFFIIQMAQLISGDPVGRELPARSAPVDI